jgi:hypothetical protein
MPTPREEPPRPPQDEPERVLGRWNARDVLLVVAVCLGLVAAAACGLGMFLLIDRWVQSCSLGWGGIL